MMQGWGEGSDGERDSVKAVIYIYIQIYTYTYIYMDKDMQIKGLDWLSHKTWLSLLFTQWRTQHLRNPKRKYIWAQPSACWTPAVHYEGLSAWERVASHYSVLQYLLQIFFLSPKNLYVINKRLMLDLTHLSYVLRKNQIQRVGTKHKVKN